MANRQQPLLIIIRGIPGSGKSVIALVLADKVGKDQVVLLDPDTTDYESEAYKRHVETAIAEGVDPSLHAYRFLRAQAYDAIAAHKVIIWNQPFTNLDIFNKMIARLRDQADEHGVELPILVVEVELDPAEARKRVLERKAAGGHGPSETTLQRRFDEYQTFAAEGYDVVTVRGDADVQASVKTITERIQAITQ